MQGQRRRVASGRLAHERVYVNKHTNNNKERDSAHAHTHIPPPLTLLWTPPPTYKIAARATYY